MLACVDVGYRDGRALAACVLFAHWRAAEALRIVRASIGKVADYKPGQFYKRELPALLAALDQCPSPPDAIVIDGYAWLGDGALPGLGARLFEALDGRSPVIGVAKTRYADDRCSLPVLRGLSRRPLFVTAAGLSATEAAEAIRSMHGDNRVPTLLKLADAACRI